MGKIGEVREISVDQLKAYERNAKIHNEDQVEKIAASINEFGFLNPCLIDKDLNIIAGHGRVMAAKKLGMQSVPCLFIEGLTDEQRRAYILADNKLTELGEWDMDLVSEELKDLKDSGLDIDLTGFNIDDIIFEDDEASWVEEPEPTLPEEPITVRGDLWQLGDHILMCGDSTNPDDVDKLMRGGTADLLITDPPYNVGLGQDKGHSIRPSEAKQLHRRTDGLVIENDAMGTEEFETFLRAAFKNAVDHMRPGAAYYCWYASTTQKSFEAALEQTGIKPRQVIIWVKQAFTLGRQDYQWKHEPCFYGWKEGAAHYFIDARTLTTVMDGLDHLTKEQLLERLKEMSSLTTAIYEDKPSRSVLHPTMKPLGLFKKQIRNSSKEGDTVLDLFGGSGTTLIACEEMNRKCRMMEYDPFYASAIIKRWEDETGYKAERIKG